jgi:hypothetical protein
MQNIDKIEKIFRLLGSDQVGEVTNAIWAIKNILLAQNKNFSDLSNHLFNRKAEQNTHYSPPYPEERKYSQDEIQYIVDELYGFALSEWEENFISNIDARNLRRNRPLTEKQEACLRKIYKKFNEDGEF